MATFWNPWHGCTKLSPGCKHCYVYRRDQSVGRDASAIYQTASFDLPLKKKKNGQYKIQPDGDFVYTCFTSDFFHPEADAWRIDAWKMMRIRRDLTFFLVTKRIDRFLVNLPSDWGLGYENVHICCTCENQQTADYRLPLFFEFPIRHYAVIHEPMLEAITIEPYLKTYHAKVDLVTCGGESGPNARVCDFDWVLSTRRQCMNYNVPFHFKQTGANFRKDGRVYRIERKHQMSQAAKANIDYSRTTHVN